MIVDLKRASRIVQLHEKINNLEMMLYQIKNAVPAKGEMRIVLRIKATDQMYGRDADMKLESLPYADINQVVLGHYRRAYEHRLLAAKRELNQLQEL